jgi:hypothetical protein
MIQNYDKFSRWNAKSSKIYTLWKFHIYWAFIQQWLTQNMWCIGATICVFNNKLQNISFKNSFIWTKWKKTKKDS